MKTKSIDKLLKSIGNSDLLRNVEENDYKIVINGVDEYFDNQKSINDFIKTLNKNFTDKCVNYNAWSDSITVFKNCAEATNCSSVGQHKRSSIDLIPNIDNETSRFDLDDENEDNYDYLLELDDTDCDYCYDDDYNEDDVLLEEGETDDSEDELEINDITVKVDGSNNEIKSTSKPDENTIYNSSEDDDFENVDSLDSTNPMTDFQSRRSGNRSISI